LAEGLLNRVGAGDNVHNDALGQRLGMEAGGHLVEDAEADQDLLNAVDEAGVDEKIPLSADDVQTADQRIANMLPVDHVTIDKVFPWLCYCRSFCKGAPDLDEEETAALVQKLDEIGDRNEKLKKIIKLKGGNYKGSSFAYDAKKAQGLQAYKLGGEDGDEL
jgi:hypothetical protein